MTQPLFAIGIPTINRWDLLRPSLNKYVGIDFPGVDIYIIDNGNQGIKGAYDEYPNVHIIEMESNLGVAASWNMLCDLIFKKYKFAFILNDDVYSGLNTGQVNTFLYVDAMVSGKKEWCSFILPQSVFNKVGRFDEEFFPAYYEDNDYAYRMRLANVVVMYDGRLTPEIYQRSSSVTKDPSLNSTFKRNMQYFEDKWGGAPGKETFTVPFNRYSLNEKILRQLGFHLLNGQWEYYYEGHKDKKISIEPLVNVLGDEYSIMEWEVMQNKFGRDAKIEYRYLINALDYEMPGVEPWYRYLYTKKDVQELIFGLTGKPHLIGI